MVKRLTLRLWWVPGVLLLLPLAVGLRSSTGDLKERGFEKVPVKNIGYAYKSTVDAPVRYAPDRVLVRFKKGVSDKDIQRLHQRLGTHVILASRYIEGLQLVRVPSGQTVHWAIKQLEKSGLVEYAEPDYQVHVFSHPNYPNDDFVWMYEDTSSATAGCDPAQVGSEDSTWFTYAWDFQMGTQCTYLDPFLCSSGYGCGGNNADGSDMNVLPCDDPNSCNTIENEGAWTDVTPVGSGPDPIVVVIDTGIDYLHQDVAPNMWQNPGEIPGNGLDDDGNGFVDDVYGIRSIGLGGDGFPDCGSSNNFGDPMDDNGHGTHVASTIAARANNYAGIVGIGSGITNRVRVAACKFLNTEGTGFTSDAIVCLEYVLWMKNKGYNVVATNNSWGGGGFSQALMDAIAAHRDAGILFVAAAGNSAVDNDTNDNYPSNYDLDNVIAVASYNQHDCLSGFSDWGARSVDISSPGSAILGACTVGGCADIPGETTYAWFFGTSMATPHVTGLVAFLKTINPNLNWWQIRNIIFTTGVVSKNGDSDCQAIGTSGDDVDSGAGLDATTQSYTGTAPDQKKTVTDRRVNALRAAQVAAAGSGDGDYALQARLWPYGDGPFSASSKVVIKAINVNGWNVGAPGSVQFDLSYTPPPPPGTVALSEDFSSGDPPTGWSVVNGPDHTCAEDWTTTNPGGRSPGPPFVDPFAIADSDKYGNGCRIQSELRSPNVDLAAAGCNAGDTILLSFSNWYNNLSSSEVASVDVSTDGGTTWTNVVTWNSDTDYPTPATRTFDITSIVGTSTQVMVRFFYDDAGGWQWYWAIDNVQIECTTPPSTTACGTFDCRDDGVYPDQAAGDGIFVCEFTPGQDIGSCTSPADGTYSATLLFDGTPYETLDFNVGSIGPGVPVAVPDSVNFGFVPVGQSKEVVVRVRNDGLADINITGITPPSSSDFVVTGFSTTTIPPGGVSEGMVTFTPSAGGDYSDSFTVSTDAGDAVFSLSGTGVGPNPDIHIPNTTVDFGSVTWGHMGSQTLLVQNTGAANLLLLSVDNSLAPSVTSMDTFPITVMPSDSALMNFEWNPNGCLDSTIRIENNDPDENFPVVNVLGFINVADVGSTFNFYVQRLVANGITLGCGTEASKYGTDVNGDGDSFDKVFCPLDGVRRDHMAAFIARALSSRLGESIGTHVNCDADPMNDVSPFTDVPATYWACDEIYYIRDKGIVSGCTATEYCPLNIVNRAQMAKFLAISMEYPNPVPDYTGIYCGAGGTSLFGDISETHWACNYVHHIYLKGVTSGCSASPLLYCPTNDVNRQQAAKFLTLAFALGCGG